MSFKNKRRSVLFQAAAHDDDVDVVNDVYNVGISVNIVVDDGIINEPNKARELRFDIYQNLQPWEDLGIILSCCDFESLHFKQRCGNSSGLPLIKLLVEKGILDLLYGICPLAMII